MPTNDAFDKAVEKWQASGVFRGQVEYRKASDYSTLLWSFGPIILLIAFWYFFMRMGSGGGGGTRATTAGQAKACDGGASTGNLQESATSHVLHN